MTDIYNKSRIRSFRKANNLSQEELASFLNVNQGYISQVEKKCAEPKELMARLLSNDKGWCIDALVEKSNVQYNTNGDNIGGDKITYSDAEDYDKDVRIAELMAVIKEKDKQIALLWSKIDEYFKK